MPTLLLNASQLVSCVGPARARRGPEMRELGLIEAVGIAMSEDGKILAVDSDAALRAAYPSAQEVDCQRGVLTPGFVDSHTHAIFGRPRHEEQELRAAGVGYLEIAKRGGGIHSSVREASWRRRAGFGGRVRAVGSRALHRWAVAVSSKPGVVVLIQAEPLRTIVAEIFTAAGTSPAEGQRIAAALVNANLVGHDSHGVGRTLRYTEWLQEGVQVADQNITVLAEAGASPEHLVRLTWYVTDRDEYVERLKELGTVYREIIGKNYPAMALVQVVAKSKHLLRSFPDGKL